MGERPDAADVDGRIHYVLFPQAADIDVEWVDGNPVILLDDAVSQMIETWPAYEPALEMLADEYDVDIDARHHDQTTAD